MRRDTGRGTRAAAALAALVLAGCPLFSDELPCKYDENCPSGMVCEQQRCVDRELVADAGHQDAVGQSEEHADVALQDTAGQDMRRDASPPADAARDAAPPADASQDAPPPVDSARPDTPVADRLEQDATPPRDGAVPDTSPLDTRPPDTATPDQQAPDAAGHDAQASDTAAPLDATVTPDTAVLDSSPGQDSTPAPDTSAFDSAGCSPAVQVTVDSCDTSAGSSATCALNMTGGGDRSACITCTAQIQFGSAQLLPGPFTTCTTMPRVLDDWTISATGSFSCDGTWSHSSCDPAEVVITTQSEITIEQRFDSRGIDDSLALDFSYGDVGANNNEYMKVWVDTGSGYVQRFGHDANVGTDKQCTSETLDLGAISGALDNPSLGLRFGIKGDNQSVMGLALAELRGTGTCAGGSSALVVDSPSLKSIGHYEVRVSLDGSACALDTASVLLACQPAGHPELSGSRAFDLAP